MSELERRFPRYSRLLRLYPAAYQRQYRDQMLQTLADMLDDPERSRTAVWARTMLELPFSILHEQLSYAGPGAQPTPPYIKQYALLGAWLVAPFFVFVILNSLLHQRLYDTVVWHRNVLFTWIVILPGLAVLLNGIALLRWMHSRRRETHAGFWQLLTDFRRNWPALSIAIIGLGILALVFGHDSVQCVAGKPVHEITHWRATLQCVRRNG